MNGKASDNLQADLQQLQTDFARLAGEFELSKRKGELAGYQKQLDQPDIWQKDSDQAQKWSRQAAELQSRLQAWLKLETDLQDLQELLRLKSTREADRAELQSLLEDCQRQWRSLQKAAARQPHDDCQAIMSIFAGAGGTDAQDWTAMLLRMYSRWANGRGVKFEILSQSAGEEAGLKSVSLLFKKAGLYGLLRGENGVHRLVRLSPFNAQNLRQTSFARVEVVPALKQPEEVDLKEADLRFDFFKSAGAGGQSVNTTDSAVRVTHLPTKLTVSVQNERSQSQNKALALDILRSKLLQLRLATRSETIAELRGKVLPNEWGSQIRNYVLHPYKQVKDLRSGEVTAEADKVLDGQLDQFLKGG